jgi:hypothetical protein
VGLGSVDLEQWQNFLCQIGVVLNLSNTMAAPAQSDLTFGTFD